jgi:hypothetical protein
MERKHTDLLDDRILDLDTLLHPSQVFEHPSDVINDPDLSLNEKRAILASWASDACAVEAAPALRKNPHGRLVAFDDIMDALRVLDRAGNATLAAAERPRAVRRGAPSGRGGGAGHGDQGAPLH